jgi:MinD-like ATPase involved in chromosome partitioning or flagellar assembly/tetratricopeptide (TPR) repeat protein
MADVGVTRHEAADRTERTERTAPGAQIITFYSYKGGAGRTMAVANVAWIMASAGKRVLVVDWDLESPGLHRYFRPFLTDKELTSTTGVIDMLLGFVREASRRQGEDLTEACRRHAALTDRTQSIRWPHFPAGGRIDLLGPGRQNLEYEVNVTSFPWSWLFDDVDGNAFIQTLRDVMREAAYDYVILDSRTGVSDVAGICTKLLPDTVVVCFAMSNQAIEGGARFAAGILQDTPPGTRVVPVPMRVEDGEHRKLEQRRNYARQKFRGVLAELVGADPEDQLRHLVELEIPYKEYYAYEEILATFGDQPGSKRSLLAAYVELTQTVSDGAVGEMAPIPPADRERVLQQFERLGPAAPQTFMVFAAPQDRAWKDWLEAQLERAGTRVRQPGGELREPGDLPEVEAVVVVVSPHLSAATPGEAAVRDWVAQRYPAADGGDRTVTAVRVAQGPVEELYEDLSGVNLTARDEQSAGDALLGHFGLTDAAAAVVPSAASGPRFPDRRPAIWDVRRRNPWFSGRTGVLNELRDGLMPGGQVRSVCAILGQQGVGKTEVALEFAHRFGSDYDVVWWIDAGQESSVRLRLAELARRMAGAADGGDGVPRQSDGALAVKAMEALRLGEPYQRWLLIYDDVGDPADLERERLLPDVTAFGHVLVTSRSSRWDDWATPVEVEPFQRGESLEYLRLRLPGAAEAQFDAVADGVRDVPLALVQATGWIRGSRIPMDEAVANVLDRLTTRGDEPAPSPAALGVDFAALKSDADPFVRAAARLLEMCVFLSPDGVSTKLVGSPAMMRHLADAVDHAGLAGGEQLPLLVQAVQRYSLAEVDASSGTIRVHRLLLEYVRTTMTEEQERVTRAAVLRILVAYAPTPTEASDPRGRLLFAELQRHVDAAGAVDSDDSDVRQWLVYQLFYLWWAGQWETARILGEKCLARWRNAAGIGWNDLLTLQLARQLANSLRSLGRFAEAFRLDEDTLARQRRDPGILHPHTLLTAGGFGADKRELGWYRDAWAEDQATLDGLRRLRGPEHPTTLDAANNLALSLFLAGEVEEALRQNRGAFDGRRRTLGAGHPATLWSQCRIAICLRELGAYEEARRLLTDAAEGLESAEGAESHFTLRARKHQSVTLRRLGEVAAARSLADATLKRFLRKFGERDSSTLACRLSLAADLHELGSHTEAVTAADESLRGYLTLYGDDHPFTNVCRTDLAVFVRATGDLARSLVLAEEAYSRLVDRLYEHHPYTVAAAVNYANCLVAADDLGEASKLDAANEAECLEFLSANHPYTRVVRENRGDSAARAAGAAPRPREDIDVDVSGL